MKALRKFQTRQFIEEITFYLKKGFVKEITYLNDFHFSIKLNYFSVVIHTFAFWFGMVQCLA